MSQINEIGTFVLFWAVVVGLPLATIIAILRRSRWVALVLYVLTLAIAAAFVMPQIGKRLAVEAHPVNPVNPVKKSEIK